MVGCKDCEKCTRSFVGKLGHAALAVSTAGLSVLPATVAAPFKRKCPQCGHPMSDHEAVKVQIQNLVAQQPQVQQQIVQQVVVLQANTTSAASAPARSKCEHCGSNFPEAPRCPECGAKATPIPPEPVTAAPVTITTVQVAPPAQPAPSRVGGAVPWHQQLVVVVLALVFLAPLGIVLLWRNKLWSERTRTMVSVASAAFFFVAVVASNT